MQFQRAVRLREVILVDKKKRSKLAFPSFSGSHPLRPADTEVKFCVGNEKNSPNSRKAFIHAASVSGPGHHHEMVPLTWLAFKPLWRDMDPQI